MRHGGLYRAAMRLPSAVHGALRGFLWIMAIAAFAVMAAWAPSQAAAATPSAGPDAIALAERYAPVVMLQERGDRCDEGEPFEPIDVDLLMGNDEVALRGPWDGVNMVAVAPDAQRLGRGLWGYHLDFPGDALRPGCTYVEWAQRLSAQGPSTAYARVVTEPGVPGKLALQYWFYYVFNDWNNTHEGDWEMIQLVFDADTAAAALHIAPAEVGYSQHSSAERAVWGDSKIELVDGTHPVVYPAAGSHANFYSSNVFLMRSGAEGMGCDDASGPSRTVRPVVATVPTDRDDYLSAYPWLGFEGRWGEQHAGVFNGPTGPNDKTQWTHPITWSQESWRDRSFVVPSGGSVGTMATDFFCDSVATGSEILRRSKANPAAAALIIAGLVLLVGWAVTRTRWRDARPEVLRRRRAWGQVLNAAWQVFRRHPRLFLGIGLVFIPIGLLVTLLQWLLFQVAVFDVLVDEAGPRNSFVALLALAFGAVFGLLGLAVVQAATARALAAIEAGRTVTALGAYRGVLPYWRPLVLALVAATVTHVVLGVSVILIPLGVYILVRWSLLAVVVGMEGDDARPGVLRRSARLTRRNWWRTASLGVGVTVLALFAGPAVGVLALIATGAAFNVVNLIAACVYVVAVPLAAIAMSVLYFDLRSREAEVAAGVTSGAVPAGPGPDAEVGPA